MTKEELKKYKQPMPLAKVDKMARLLLNKIKKSYEAAIY